MRLVVRSVNYADMLRVTLPAWRAMLGSSASITVVTSREDEESFAVARDCGAEAYVTDAWTRKPGHFDGGTAADEAFGFVPSTNHPPEVGETCISADADSYPVGQLPARLEPGTIYGCARYDCPTGEDLRRHLSGEVSRSELGIIPRLGHRPCPVFGGGLEEAERWARHCLGFFQMWTYAPGQRLGASSTAGGYDIEFAKRFSARAGLVDFYVMHLGERTPKNWRGRVVPRFA